jgi:hypothetical protein
MRNDRWSLELLRIFGEKMFSLREKGGGTGIAKDVLSSAGELDSGADSVDQIGVSAMVVADWAECGFPQVRCGPRLGESFMATRVPGSALPEQLAPWSTMLLELPKNTLRAHELTRENGWSETEYYDWVILQNNPSSDPNHLDIGAQSTHANWAIWPISSAMGLHASVWSRSLAEMADQAESIEAVPGDMFGNRRDPEQRDSALNVDAVATTGRMLIKFVLGCLLEMNSSSNSGAMARHLKKGQPRSRGRPTSWVFRLERPIIVDCREYVRSASQRGDKCAVTVQTLVRGHWKNQAHGPSGCERKFIHIEPYWRGPENAPIAVRPHVLRDKKSSDNGDPGEAERNAAE